MVTPNFVAYIYQGDESAIPKLLAGLKEIQGLLTARPGHYFDGDNVSYADCAVVPFLGRMLTFGKAGESYRISTKRRLSRVSLFLEERVLEERTLMRTAGLIAGTFYDDLMKNEELRPIVKYTESLMDLPAFKVSRRLTVQSHDTDLELFSHRRRSTPRILSEKRKRIWRRRKRKRLRKFDMKSICALRGTT